MIIKIVEDILKSLKTTSGGYSGRKLSAFASVCVSAFLSYLYTDKTILTTVLLIWLSFAALCLGIVTIEKIIQLKNGVMDKPEDDKENKPV